MMNEGIWQQADSLMKRAVAAISGVNLNTDNNWDIVVAVNLYQAYERLASVFVLLMKGFTNLLAGKLVVL